MFADHDLVVSDGFDFMDIDDKRFVYPFEAFVS
jgi:hypothetical protein